MEALVSLASTCPLHIDLSLRIDPLPLDPAWHEKNAGTIFDLFLFQPVSAPIEGGLEAYATALQRLEPFAYDDAIM